MDTAMDVASVVLFIVLIMYAAIKLDEAARKLRRGCSERIRIYDRCQKWQRGNSVGKGQSLPIRVWSFQRYRQE